MAVPVVLNSRSREARRLITTRNGRHARRGTLKDSFRGLIRRKNLGHALDSKPRLPDQRHVQVIGISGGPASSFNGSLIALDDSDDLACYSRPPDGFKQSNRVECLIGRTA